MTNTRYSQNPGSPLSKLAHPAAPMICVIRQDQASIHLAMYRSLEDGSLHQNVLCICVLNFYMEAQNVSFLTIGKLLWFFCKVYLLLLERPSYGRERSRDIASICQFADVLARGGLVQSWDTGTSSESPMRVQESKAFSHPLLLSHTMDRELD